MKKIATVLFSALMLASTCASARKAGKIDKIETDTTGNLLVTINDGVYSFSAKEVYSITRPIQKTGICLSMETIARMARRQPVLRFANRP